VVNSWKGGGANYGKTKNLLGKIKLAHSVKYLRGELLPLDYAYGYTQKPAFVVAILHLTKHNFK